jgi:hypothetical protein
LLWANKLNIKYCIMIFLAEIYLLLEWDWKTVFIKTGN